MNLGLLKFGLHKDFYDCYKRIISCAEHSDSYTLIGKECRGNCQKLVKTLLIIYQLVHLFEFNISLCLLLSERSTDNTDSRQHRKCASEVNECCKIK